MAAGASADTSLGSAGGYSYVADSGPSNEGEVTVGVDCPGNRHVLGGGWDGNASRLEVVDGPDSGHVPDDSLVARVDNGVSNAGASVVCAAGATKREAASKTFRPQRTVSVKAQCPAGTKVTGGGGAIQGDFTDSARLFNSSYPYDGSDPDTKPDDGWGVRAFNFSPSGSSGVTGTIRAQAICVSTARPKYVQQAETMSPSGAESSEVPCPETRHVVSFGIDAAGSAESGAAPLQLGSSDFGPDADDVPDDAAFVTTENLSGDAWPYLLTAVCLG